MTTPPSPSPPLPSLDEQLLLQHHRTMRSLERTQNDYNNTNGNAAAAAAAAAAGRQLPPPLDELAHWQHVNALVDMSYHHARKAAQRTSLGVPKKTHTSTRENDVYREHEMTLFHQEMRARYAARALPLSKAVIRSILDPLAGRVEKCKTLRQQNMERPITMREISQGDRRFGALFSKRPVIESHVLNKMNELRIGNNDQKDDTRERFDREMKAIVRAEPFKRVENRPLRSNNHSRILNSDKNRNAFNNTGAGHAPGRQVVNVSDDSDEDERSQALGFTSASRMLKQNKKASNGTNGNTRKRRLTRKSSHDPFHPAKQLVSLMETDEEENEDAHSDVNESPNSLIGPRKRAKFVSPVYKKNEDETAPQKDSKDTSKSKNKKKKVKSNKGEDDDTPPDDVGRHFEDGEIPEELQDLDPRLIDNIMCDVLQSKSNVSFEDIAGLKDVKKNIQEMVVWPMSRPDLFSGNRQPPRCVMLFGPPGTGKTLIAKAVAFHIQSKFFNISASSLMSKWVGEGERLVKTLFRLARHFGRSVIFIDEIDSLLSKRTDGDMDSGVRRVKTEFLVGLDGAGTDRENDRILFIGATNLPWQIDEAVRRRFAKKIMVPLPDAEARLDMIKNMMRNGDEKYSLSQEDLEVIVKETDGYSGSDMHNLCKEAVMNPLRDLMQSINDYTKINSVEKDDIPPVKVRDFQAAMRHIRASVSPDDLQVFDDWNNEHGSTASW